MIQERRLFSTSVGDICTLVFAVLEMPLTEEVAIVFNDTVVPVYPTDTACDVLGRWEAKHSKK